MDKEKPNSPVYNHLKFYYDILRDAGAKHASELGSELWFTVGKIVKLTAVEAIYEYRVNGTAYQTSVGLGNVPEYLKSGLLTKADITLGTRKLVQFISINPANGAVLSHPLNNTIDCLGAPPAGGWHPLPTCR